MRFIIWIILSIGVGFFAKQKGRNVIGWAFLSLIISPVLGFIILLLLKDLSVDGENNINIDKSNVTVNNKKGDILKRIEKTLKSKGIFYAEDVIGDKLCVIAYEKKFKLKWMATQMNTFVVASDFGEETVTKETIENFMKKSFVYAKDNYKGWPKGMQSGMGVISILISSNVDNSAISYCEKLKIKKKFAGFAVPVVINSSSNEVHYFNKKPTFGRIYYPHFEEIIKDIT